MSSMTKWPKTKFRVLKKLGKLWVNASKGSTKRTFGSFLGQRLRLVDTEFPLLVGDYKEKRVWWFENWITCQVGPSSCLYTSQRFISLISVSWFSSFDGHEKHLEFRWVAQKIHFHWAVPKISSDLQALQDSKDVSLELPKTWAPRRHKAAAAMVKSPTTGELERKHGLVWGWEYGVCKDSWWSIKNVIFFVILGFLGSTAQPRNLQGWPKIELSTAPGIDICDIW